MATTLTLHLSDEVYLPLFRKAKQIGQTPEEFIAKCIENFVTRSSDEDPLLKLAGIFSSDITDICARHDEFIGQSLLNNDK